MPRTLYYSFLATLPIAIVCSAPFYLLSGYVCIFALVVFTYIYAKLITPVVVYALTDDQRYDPDFAPGVHVEITRSPGWLEICELIDRSGEVSYAEGVTGYIIDTDGIIAQIETDGVVIPVHLNCLAVLPDNITTTSFFEEAGEESIFELDE